MSGHRKRHGKIHRKNHGSDPIVSCPLWSRIIKNPEVRNGPLARPFTRTAHSFAYFGLLASLAPSAALTRLLACLLISQPSLVGKQIISWLLILCCFLFWIIVVPEESVLAME